VISDPTSRAAIGDAATTLIVNAVQVDGALCDILVAGERIAAIAPHDPGRPLPEGAHAIDGRRRAALPGLMNGHTHTAMVMMRGWADDMPLMPWLEERIWPIERHLSREDVYCFARLGCIEMIRTGTTFFSDMYWHWHGTAAAARDSGLRALLAGAIFDLGQPERVPEQQEQALAEADAVSRYGPRVRYALGPHAIYTVGEPLLRWIAETAAARDLPIHTHISETAHEVAECVREHGVRPVAYLERVGLLGPRLLAAHAVHLDDAEIALLARAGATVLHNPVSNLKLSSGGPMRYTALRDAGVNVVVGTDGAASNNSLDLSDDLKFAALLAKHATGDPTAMTADEALGLVTTNGARAFGVDAGELAPGKLADFILVDLDHPLMFPGHDLAADLVYSAAGRAVVTTVCNGRVLLEDGIVADEAAIRAEARERWARLVASL